MADADYVREEDRRQYQGFWRHHLPGFGRPLPPEIWHYTNADGLIGILKSGHIWSTQVACMNDSLEQRYFGDLVHKQMEAERGGDTDPTLDVLYRVAEQLFAQRDFATAGHFVACFSEVEDDLGQWRGYGGGECGYAIGFRPDGIEKALQKRIGGGLVLPMNYDDGKHLFLAKDVVRWAKKYFQEGLTRGLSDSERWAREHLMAFAIELDIFASLIKHPKFFGEVEWRITATLQAGEHSALMFRQKRTLLARHLPLVLAVPANGNKLPITRIYIGPGPAQHISKISVGDLLAQTGYAGIPVEVSKVPYRVP